MNSNYRYRSVFVQIAEPQSHGIEARIPKYPVACCRDRNSCFWFWSDNVAFDKIVLRFYPKFPAVYGEQLIEESREIAKLNMKEWINAQ